MWQQREESSEPRIARLIVRRWHGIDDRVVLRELDAQSLIAVEIEPFVAGSRAADCDSTWQALQNAGARVPGADEQCDHLRTVFRCGMAGFGDSATSPRPSRNASAAASPSPSLFSSRP